MPRRRTLLLGHSLLVRGVARWLSEEGIETEALDARTLDTARRSSSPIDAIVVDADGLGSDAALLWELVREHPEALVVELDGNGNTVGLLRQSEVVIGDAADLLRVLSAAPRMAAEET